MSALYQEIAAPRAPSRDESPSTLAVRGASVWEHDKDRYTMDVCMCQEVVGHRSRPGIRPVFLAGDKSQVAPHVPSPMHGDGIPSEMDARLTRKCMPTGWHIATNPVYCDAQGAPIGPLGDDFRGDDKVADGDHWSRCAARWSPSPRRGRCICHLDALVSCCCMDGYCSGAKGCANSLVLVAAVRAGM